MDAVTSRRVAVRSQSELVTAIAQLTAGEKIAIMKVARLYSRGMTYDQEDLLHEAFARVLEGRRTWPSHVGATMFFGGVLRSIAWEWRCDRRGETAMVDIAAESHPNADAALDAEKILAIFDDDPVARRIVIAMMDGARGEELVAVSGLGKREYESKRTKIRRRIDRFFDDGR